MEKSLLCFLLTIAVVNCKGYSYIPRNRSTLVRKVACTAKMDQDRNDLIDKAICGEPREAFVYLNMNTPHEEVSPNAVWVKRCGGLCDYTNDGSCVITEVNTIHIPIRIYNVKTDKETCTTYPIIEHLGCRCEANDEINDIA